MRLYLEKTLPALLWALAAGAYASLAIARPGAVSLELAVYYTLASVMFLVRRHQSRSSPLWGTLFAWLAAAAPMFLMRCSGVEAGPGSVIEVTALAWMLYSMHSLGRSFGIAPADRGVVTGGAYRVVRHPLYAGELLFFLGCVVGNPTVRNGLVLAGEAVADLVRILMEERVVSGYEEYAQRVRWRLIPGVF